MTNLNNAFDSAAEKARGINNVTDENSKSSSSCQMVKKNASVR